MGKFTVDGYTSSGGPDGLILEISAKAADMREKMKEKKSEHFDNTTLGAMLKKVFTDAGGTIEVDSRLASIKIDYEARQAQSALDFATRLADRHNAIFKPANGIYLMVPRGSQNKLSGGAMRALSILRSECKDWEISGKPRPRYGRVVAKWHDTKEGKTKFETEVTGGQGPIRLIETHYKNQADAKAVAKAEATRLNRAKGEGHFTQYGRVEATAEIDVVASGFGPAENGLWRAKAVEHTFSKGDGFQTKVEVEAPETGKAN
jgi:phage protein D